MYIIPKTIYKKTDELNRSQKSFVFDFVSKSLKISTELTKEKTTSKTEKDKE